MDNSETPARPSFWIPWLMIVSIASALLCVGASICVIVTSHNQEVNSWPIQPAVFLAIFSSTLHICLGGALTTGITIRFYLSAYSGTKFRQLHDIWNTQGVGLVSSLRSGSAARHAALVTLLVYMAGFVNGPLLQRSTHQVNRERVSRESLRMDMASRLPDGWTGYIGNGSAITMVGSRNGLADVQQWWRNDAMHTRNNPPYSCSGVCSGSVPGAGISVNCTTTTSYLDLSSRATDGAVIFAINSTMMLSNSTPGSSSPFLHLTTLHSSSVSNSCIATLLLTTCDITAGLVAYPILLTNTTITLNLSNPPAILSTYTSPGDLPTTPPNSPAGPLAGLNNFFGYYLAANVTQEFDPALNRSTYSGPSMFADLFFEAEAQSYTPSVFAHCGLRWRDPTGYAVGAMHEFMFRGALREGGEGREFAVERRVEVLLFESDFRPLGVALGVVVGALGGLVGLQWGWWRLGRRVSLSPLETAGLLGGAGALREVGEGVGVKGILEAIGEEEFRVAEGEGVGVVGRAEVDGVSNVKASF